MDKKKAPRVWHKGPPPHAGWWNASRENHRNAWRWWDGTEWSYFVYSHWDKVVVAHRATKKASDYGILWTDYWPENARVPRVDPRLPQASLNGTDFALLSLREKADQLVELAKTRGYVVTIDLAPVMPPRMGQYSMRVCIRPARGST
jgi:hypothetical protein